MSLPILIINCTAPVLLQLNQTFVGECSPEKSCISLPLSEGSYYFGVIPLCAELEGFWTGITVRRGKIWLQRTEWRLCCWHGHIFEWNLELKKKPGALPPVAHTEVEWNGRSAGLYGEYLLLETEDGGVRYRSMGPGFGKGELAVVNRRFLLACGEEKQLYIVNDRLETVLERRVNRWSLENGRLHFEEHMDMIQGYRYSETYLCGEELQREDSLLEYAPGHPCFDSPGGVIVALCEAVRLGLEEQAMDCVTASLAERISFAEICDFLGEFIDISPVRYLSAARRESIALLYEREGGELEYVCYGFAAAETEGRWQIDDIQEL